MSEFDTLPIVLVSAANECVASTFISELIDDDVSADYSKETQSSDRVWRLVNKYYTAHVRVHPLSDDGKFDIDSDAVEAYLIHITEDELREGGGVAAGERRVARGGGAWRAARVRVVACEARAEPAAEGAWAAAQRAHLVPLRAPPDRAALEPPGLQRLRAALHAHVWRGLRRTDRAAPPPAPLHSSDSSAGEEDSDTEELRAVEHAEAFAAALGALPLSGAGAEPGAAGGAGDVDVARRERAEALVAAFCRALGYDLDAC